MNALEEMKKRREEEEAAQNSAAKIQAEAKREEADAHSSGVLNDMKLFIEKINSYGTGKKKEVGQVLDLHHLHNAIVKEAAKAICLDTASSSYHPSLTWLLRYNGKVTASEWETIVEEGHLRYTLPKSYPEWLDTINTNPDFIKQLTQAVIDAEERMDKRDKKTKMRHRKRTALICLPLSVFFFFLLFVFKNVSLVWGSVILMAIMVVVNFMFMGSHSIGNKIAQLISIPFLGGFLGLVIGGGAWVISNISMTFTAVLWAIVIFIANMIVIFAFDEAELD